MMAEIKTKADITSRKWLMTAESFKHPAKLSIPVLLWIVQKYTKGASDLTIIPEMLYNMDKEIRWCNCADSNL